MRACTKCGSTTNGFAKCKRTKDGLASRCKKCLSEQNKQHLQDVPEARTRHNKMTSDWQKNNPERTVAKTLRYLKKNPQRARFHSLSKARNWYAPKGHRSVWANGVKIRIAHITARMMTEYLGIHFVVDHIIPLKHEAVCGLHVENNLQVITASGNLRKGSYFDPDNENFFRSMT